MMSFNDFSQVGYPWGTSSQGLPSNPTSWPPAPGAPSSLSGQQQSSMGMAPAASWPPDASLNARTSPSILDPLISQQLAAMMQTGALNGQLPMSLPPQVPQNVAPQQLQANPLAMAAAMSALLGQLHPSNSQANGAYGAPPPPQPQPSVNMFQQNFMGSSMPNAAAPNPWALILAASQAHALSAGLPPELLQQYGGLTGPTATLPFMNPLPTDPPVCQQPPKQYSNGTPYPDINPCSSQGAPPVSYSQEQPPSPRVKPEKPTAGRHKREAQQLNPERVVKRSSSDEQLSANSGSSDEQQHQQASKAGKSSKEGARQPATNPAAPAASSQKRARPSSATGVSDAALPAKQVAMGPPPPRTTNCGASSILTAGVTSTCRQTSSKEQLRTLLGETAWCSVRNTMIQQQRTFVQQLYELHKLIHMQQLLVMEVGSETGQEVDPHMVVTPLAPRPHNASHCEGSVQSQPSVCAPSLPEQHRGGGGGSAASLPPGVGSKGPNQAAVVTPVQPQQVQVHLAHLVNIPGPLRSKAKSASPDNSLASGSVQNGGLGMSGVLVASKLPGAELLVKPPEGVLRPQPTRLVVRSSASKQHSVSVVQPADTRCTVRQEVGSDKQEVVDQQVALPGTAEHSSRKVSQEQIFAEPPAAPAPSKAAASSQAPSAIPASSPANVLEAAAALLQSTGGALPAPPTLSTQLVGSAGLPRLASKQTGSTPASSAGPPPLIIPPVPNALLAGPSSLLGLLHPAITLHKGLSASMGVPDVTAAASRPPITALPCVDPHAAWFSKHYSASSDAARGSQPSSAAAAAPPGVVAAASAALAAPPPLTEPVHWWQNEEGTFGDVAPSLLTQQLSNVSTVKPGACNKKASRANLHATFAGGVHKGAGDEGWDAPADDAAAAAALVASAFKVVWPRKQRSKRGSNRLGPRDEGMASDDSGTSAHEGSVIGGGSVSFAGGAGASFKQQAAGVGRNVSSSHLQVDIVAVDAQHSNPSPALSGRIVEPVWLDAPCLPESSAGGLKGASSASGTEPGGEDKSAAGILLSLSCGVGGAKAVAAAAAAQPVMSTARQLHTDTAAAQSTGAPPMSVSA